MIIIILMIMMMTIIIIKVIMIIMIKNNSNNNIDNNNVYDYNDALWFLVRWNENMRYRKWDGDNLPSLLIIITHTVWASCILV